MGLPDGDGTDLIPGTLQAGVRVIVMSVFNNGARLNAALAAGAHGCLFKDSSPIAVGRAVRHLFDPEPMAANQDFLRLQPKPGSVYWPHEFSPSGSRKEEQSCVTRVHGYSVRLCC